jgi:hypothetical protein
MNLVQSLRRHWGKTLVGALILLLGLANGWRTNWGRPIDADEADQYVGKTVTVSGNVAQIRSSKGRIYINFDDEFPHQCFAAVVDPQNFDEFAYLLRKADRLSEDNQEEMSLEGKIELWNGKPIIRLKSRSQIIEDTDPYDAPTGGMTVNGAPN